jgi:prenyltransferase beta subunit
MAPSDAPSPPELSTELVSFRQVEIGLSQYLKMNALYWTSMALTILKYQNFGAKKQAVLAFMQSCFRPDDGIKFPI